LTLEEQNRGGRMRENRGEVQGDGRGLGVGVRLRRAKKEKSESERSAQKEISALVDSGSGQFQTRRWTVSHAISPLSLSLSLSNVRGCKM